ERLQKIPDYAPDFIFTYPADSIVLYPFQVIIVSHLISYFWGLKKKAIARKIEQWNQPFVDLLCKVPYKDTVIPDNVRPTVEHHARNVLQEFSQLLQDTHYCDRMEGQRREAILSTLSLLAGEAPDTENSLKIGGFLHSERGHIPVKTHRYPVHPVDNQTYLSLLKDIALELSNGEQSKQLADHFLVDEEGITIPTAIDVSRPRNRTRSLYEPDYLAEYEGLGTFYDVEPVHPPKIAKAKKGWL
ncbi:MAG: hypothetical protein F6K03_15930, partial [Kamptonema sp. SIO4C4]|nr:hypothetical protein [Kamptonema sp. SIO4C4]